MGSCEELASRIVALGIGCKSDIGRYDVTNWRNNGPDKGDELSEELIAKMCPLFADQFVRDGRVVLALMEKLDDGDSGRWIWVHKNNCWNVRYGLKMFQDESLAIAIATACVEALENG